MTYPTCVFIKNLLCNGVFIARFCKRGCHICLVVISCMDYMYNNYSGLAHGNVARLS